MNVYTYMVLDYQLIWFYLTKEVWSGKNYNLKELFLFNKYVL